ASGKRALRIRRKLERLEMPGTWPTPRAVELVRRPLGAGLECQLPLGLPLRSHRTRPRGGTPASTEPARDQDPQALSAASVIVAWNVFQHFYPYHDVIGGPWDRVLDDALVDASDDRSTADAYDTMRRLVVRLDDGHGWVYPSNPPRGILPADLVGVGDAVIVQ